MLIQVNTSPQAFQYALLYLLVLMFLATLCLSLTNHLLYIASLASNVSNNTTHSTVPSGISSLGSLPTHHRTEGEILSSPNLKAFSFNELKNATKNFRPDSLLGEGGFGRVFKGWIDETTLTASRPGSGIVVAVKKLKPEGFQGHKEWLVSPGYFLWLA